jgi:hypothetical protein
VIKYLKEIGLLHYTLTPSTDDKERHTTENQEKWKPCKDDTMMTTANELGEREEKGKQDEEKGKQDKETEGKTDWTCNCNTFLVFYFLIFISDF